MQCANFSFLLLKPPLWLQYIHFRCTGIKTKVFLRCHIEHNGGHVICRAGGTGLPWGWLPWAAGIRSVLCHVDWPHKHSMTCHRCCCGCRDVSEDIENCSTSDDKKHYSFLLHSEVHNIPEHQFFFELEVNWASVMGIWVKRNVLGNLPIPSTQATPDESWVALSHDYMWASQRQNTSLIVTGGKWLGLLVKCFEIIFSFSSHKSTYSSITNSQMTSLFVLSYLTLYTESVCIICMDLRWERKIQFSFYSNSWMWLWHRKLKTKDPKRSTESYLICTSFILFRLFIRYLSQRANLSPLSFPPVAFFV